MKQGGTHLIAISAGVGLLGLFAAMTPISVTPACDVVNRGGGGGEEG